MGGNASVWCVEFAITRQVAAIYREEILARQKNFDCIAFAIFYPGYGNDNFTPFREVLCA